jgi:hypothetical protein
MKKRAHEYHELLERRNIEIEGLFRLADDGVLPDDFKDWDLKDPAGTPIIHVVINRGNLPKNFGIISKRLWRISNKHGMTAAHLAAVNGCLPSYFNEWEMRDAQNRTVAHMAAMYKNLPKDFGKKNPGLWKLKENLDWTVAHEAARRGCLPDDFGNNNPELWDMETTYGHSVKEVWENFRNVPMEYIKEK